MNKNLDDALVNPYLYADDASYHRIFTYLRAEDPVHWAQPDGVRPFWAISRHADIREIELQPEIFRNEPRSTLAPLADEESVRQLTGGSVHVIRSLVAMDNPDHRLFRSLTQGWFAAKNINKLEAELRALAGEFIDVMRDLGKACDFVNDVAVWYPLRAVMKILGVPREDDRLMLRLTRELFGPSDPEMRRDDGGLAGFFATFKEMDEYFNALTEQRRHSPCDDIATIIAHAEINGQPISRADALSYYIILATAGHDTTSSSMAGGLLALLQNPTELARLRAQPELLGSAVDECIRWTTPVKHFFRTASQDYVLRGRRIEAGQSLMMCYPSANRDEEMFDDPFSFRIDRSPARHLAFGTGPHLCLGQHLAKLEIRILFEELFARIDHIELAGEPASVQSCFVSGLKRLPVRYRMRESAQGQRRPRQH